MNKGFIVSMSSTTTALSDIPNGVVPLPMVTDWYPTVEGFVQQRAIDFLESGQIVLLPNLPFAIKPAEMSIFTVLNTALKQSKAKNISYNVKTNTLSGLQTDSNETVAVLSVLKRYAHQTATLLNQLLPHYTPSLMQQRTSYRAVEIQGRKAPSIRKDDTKLHVDAFPVNPTQGNRILRVFTNINPHGQPRHWHVGEPFETVATQFLPQLSTRQLPGIPKLLRQLNLTKSYRTNYDHIMLQLHNSMKEDARYQQTASHVSHFLPAGSTWIVFTDQVPHAALSGQYVLEQTFSLSVTGMWCAEKSPLNILERLTAKTLR